MPKILVADDNSNIQKMVGLALKDQGIDVVAVGNGEAAVRKISDVQPDLVLADVFMPVRNGYEVCEYVKADTALSHIPVILLVGAFDPLDEQEAQRVGADGVLKKPFVPPDPLISMVKSALARAGVSHSSDKNAAPAAPEPPKQAADEPRPQVAAFPVVELPPEAANESFVEEVPARPATIQFSQGDQPLAFGNMLESPVSEPEAEEASFIPPSAMALERDWRSSDDEEIEEEDEEPKAGWRRDGADDAFEGADGVPAVPDWREAAFKQAESSRDPLPSWTQTEEQPLAQETASGTASVHSSSTEPPAAPSTPAYAGDAWTTAISAGSDSAANTAATPRVEEFARETNSPEVALESAATEVPATNPWDTEARKATQLASTWDAPAAPPAIGPAFVSESAAEDVQAALPAEAVEAIREEVAQVHEGPEEAPANEALAASTASEAAAAPSTEDVVAKVLAKLSPEVLQAVTRDILKPVIESIVREELGQKK